MLRSMVSSHNRHGPKSGGGCCATYHGGELGPNLTQCHLGQGLPPWHPDPSSHLGTTDIGLKVGAAVSLLWGNWVPSNTMRPGARPTSIPSGTLIHPTIWPQYTNITDRQDRQQSESIELTILQTVAQKQRGSKETVQS